MTNEKQPTALEWRDGSTPISPRFDDPYFSLDDGLQETRHVFLQGNDLPARFAPDFHIAELGFGTGLNLAATLIAWQACGAPAPLRYTSFEAYPLSAPDMTRALAAFPPALAALAPYIEAIAQTGQAHADGLQITIRHGDARETLPAWQDAADAWYLDGFSPAKNPELWSADLLAQVGSHTQAGGSFATYTAAGHVRRALEAAGFDVARVAGYGRKRHMSIGRLRP